MKKERIVLGEVTGTYEDKHFKIEISPVWYDCKVFCNGKEIRDVSRVLIDIKAGHLTSVILEKIPLEAKE